MNGHPYTDQHVLFPSVTYKIDIAHTQFEWVIFSICPWLTLETKFAHTVICYSLTSLLNASTTRHICCEQLPIFNLF